MAEQATTGGEQRQSEAFGWTGAPTVLERSAPRPSQVAKDVANAARTNPMRLLSELERVHPTFAFAAWNAIRLTCSPSSVRVVAVPAAAGRKKGRPRKADVSDEGTAAIEEMWRAQPNEVGGLVGFQTQAMASLLFTGMAVAEAVPGPGLTGVKEALPVDSLTTELYREKRGSPWAIAQWMSDPPQGLKAVDLSAKTATGAGAFRMPVARGSAPGAKGSLVALNEERVKWVAVDQRTSAPQGLAPFATAMYEVLADMAMIQDVRDAVHNAAWPRLDVGVNLENLHKVAVEVYRMNAEAATKWVNDRFAEVVERVKKLGPGDNVVHHSSGKTSLLQPGGFTGLEGVMNYLRQRLGQSLKSLPTLLGISDGGLQNYTSVEWQIYTSGIEALAELVDQLTEWACTMHLRLLGLPLVAKVVRKRIRTTDALVEANTLNVRLQNAIQQMRLGFKSQEQACVEINGESPAGPVMEGALTPPSHGVTGQHSGDGSGGRQQGAGGNANTNNATPAERRAAGGGGSGKQQQ